MKKKAIPLIASITKEWGALYDWHTVLPYDFLFFSPLLALDIMGEETQCFIGRAERA